jgi:hypothetical protein
LKEIECSTETLKKQAETMAKLNLSAAFKNYLRHLINVSALKVQDEVNVALFYYFQMQE